MPDSTEQLDAIGRRDLIALVIQAILMAIFPWLRTGVGARVAERAADAMVEQSIFKGGAFKVSFTIKGWEISQEWYEAMLESGEVVNCIRRSKITPIDERDDEPPRLPVLLVREP